MLIFQIGFIVLILVFGLLFIRRNRISFALKAIAIVLIFILGIITLFDTLFDNGFGYSTPVDVEILNKTNTDLKIFGVLIFDGCCDNKSQVYSYGEIKSNDKSLKTIEAECVYDFSILAFNSLDEIVYAEHKEIDTKLSLQVILMDSLKKIDKDVYVMYKDKIDEFDDKENGLDLYKLGIIIFSMLILFLIFRKNNYN